MTKKEANQKLIDLGFSSLKVEKFPYGWKLVDTLLTRQDFVLRRRIAECVSAAKHGDLPVKLPLSGS